MVDDGGTPITPTYDTGIGIDSDVLKVASRWVTAFPDTAYQTGVQVDNDILTTGTPIATAGISPAYRTGVLVDNNVLFKAEKVIINSMTDASYQSGAVVEYEIKLYDPDDTAYVIEFNEDNFVIAPPDSYGLDFTAWPKFGNGSLTSTFTATFT